jgi:hypothetical protein
MIDTLVQYRYFVGPVDYVLPTLFLLHKHIICEEFETADSGWSAPAKYEQPSCLTARHCRRNLLQIIDFFHENFSSFLQLTLIYLGVTVHLFNIY